MNRFARGARRCLLGGLAALAILMVAPGPAATAASGATHRPVSDFLDAQTLSDIVDWLSGDEGDIEYRARLDFVGVINRDYATPNGHPFGTTFDGDITERVLADGRTEVHVVLHGHHVMGVVGAGQFLTPATTVWGRLAGYALPNGLSVDFCETKLDLTFITPAAPGSPMPRLAPLLFNPGPGQEVLQVHTVAQGVGELRALFGVADGTPGRMTLNEKGIFNAAFEGGTSSWEPFPASVIKLQVVGN